MEWDLGDIKIRPWKNEDVDTIVKHANNRKVWQNLRDRFPHPYTLEHAKEWSHLVATTDAGDNFWTIEVNGEAAGGISLTVGQDVHRGAAEIGYWVGEEHWNKGIVTRAVGVVTQYGLDELGLHRIFTGIYEWNPASMRVLEKNGYVKEGIERKSIIKDGKVIDAHVWAKVKE